MNHIEFNALLEQWKTDTRMTIGALCKVSGYSRDEVAVVRAGGLAAAIPDLVQSMAVVEEKGLFRKPPIMTGNVDVVGLGQYMVRRPCKTCGGRVRFIESKKCVKCAAIKERREQRKARYAARKQEQAA